jgi:hypothetical protein
MRLKWVERGFTLVPLIIGAVNAIENLVTGLRGSKKQDAAVDFTRSILISVEGLAGKDLIDDVKVQAAVRTLIDAAVAVQNAVASAKIAKTV